MSALTIVIFYFNLFVFFIEISLISLFKPLLWKIRPCSLHIDGRSAYISYIHKYNRQVIHFLVPRYSFDYKHATCMIDICNVQSTPSLQRNICIYFFKIARYKKMPSKYYPLSSCSKKYMFR